MCFLYTVSSVFIFHCFRLLGAYNATRLGRIQETEDIANRAAPGLPSSANTLPGLVRY